MKRVKTSLTDPIKIAEVRHHVFTGVIGITFCPGKKQEDGWTAVWDRNLSTDLDAIKQWGATTVISLIEDHEIADLCVGRLGTDVAARGMQWLHLPIVDMSVPDHRFQAGWLEVRGKILEQLRSGSRIVVHCKGGLGRAGTVSARILLELGVSAEEAIGLVRAARPGAIENDQQEEYVREFGELLSQTDTSRMNRYARLLPTLERELGSDRCKEVMCALWASRNGMTKKEVMAYADMLESQWQSFFQTMGSALRINEYRVLLADDDVKNTVAERYLVQDVTLSGEMTFGKLRSLRNEAHAKLARWFEQHAFRNEKAAQFAVDDARAAEEVPYQWWKARDWTALQAVLTNRDMFLALYVNRSNQEILSYWLDLERETNIELETAYEAVWWRWCADDLSEETGDIADRLRSFLVEAGRYRKLADNLARLALAAESMTYGPESEQVSARLNDLALLLEAQGKSDDAEFLMRRALAIAEKTLGSEHTATAIRLCNLGRTLKIKGDNTSAEGMLWRALRILDAKLDCHDPLISDVLDNLAEVLRAQGKYESAEPLYRRALSITERSNGPEHRTTSIVLNNLASFLLDKGDLAAAEPLLKRALAISENVDGPAHPETGTRLSNLALLLQRKGKLDSAESLFRRALAIAEKSEGFEHPSTGTVLNNLAMLLLERGQHAEAETLMRRASSISEMVFGSKHSSYALGLHNLAEVLKAKGETEAAGVLQRRALLIAEQALGPEHPDLCNYLCTLADLLQEEKQHSEAVVLYRRALAIIEAAFGPETDDAMSCLVGLGTALISVDQREEGERCLVRALEVAEKLQFGGPFYTVAEFRILQGDHQEALKLLGKCYEIRRNTLPPSHSAIFDAAQKIAELTTILGQQPR